MQKFTCSQRVTGIVQSCDYDNHSFTVKCRNNDEYNVNVEGTTSYNFIRNLDGLDLDRSVMPQGISDPIKANLERYIKEGYLVSAYGIFQVNDNQHRYDAKEITLFHDCENRYLFEMHHWWLTQITCLADQWLLNLFGEGDNFDFTKYQTNLSFIGSKTNSRIQECATLSRLIYGLSSAYLMTGNDRYYQAAKKGVEYQRNTFRSDSHDGSFVVWSHAYDTETGEKILPSGFSDDNNAIPLYEQIYALSGLTQFYRISSDWETLSDIKRTMKFFEERFSDMKDGEFDGFFSHVDYATMDPDTPILGDNCAKKNWNSMGDHAPAYLLNLMLAIENIGEFQNFYKACRDLQEKLADLITKHFPDPNVEIPFVRERFYKDWTPDLTYKWQQDRAVVGHNLKIAWNMTRLYNFVEKEEYINFAKKLGDSMIEHGLDQVRGGWFDLVEREPKNGMPYDFAYHNRKTWWQQEQGILAYLILYGITGEDNYLALARESLSFWNMAYLNRDYKEEYFMVIDDGLPYVMGTEQYKGSHSKSGYHTFELNFLSQLYIRTYVTRDPFRIYFKLSDSRTSNTLNTQLDYMPKGILKMSKVYVNGNEYHNVDWEKFQIHLDPNIKNVEVVVEYKPNIKHDMRKYFASIIKSKELVTA